MFIGGSWYFRDFHHVVSGIHQVSPWELRLAWENPDPLQLAGCDGCDRFINSDLFISSWCFPSFPSSPFRIHTLCACQGF